MKSDVKYGLFTSNQPEHVGYFLNGLYYDHPFWEKQSSGSLDTEGNFYYSSEPPSENPTGKLTNNTLIKFSTGEAFEVREINI